MKITIETSELPKELQHYIAKEISNKQVLLILADDGDWEIRAQVAKNSNTPEEALLKLADDEDFRVREKLAENPYLSEELFYKLAEDSMGLVKSSLANNPNIPVEVLDVLSYEKRFENVRLEVAKNPKTMPETLSRLADDDDVNVRISVAINANTPDEALLKLAEDKESYVSEIATKRRFNKK